MLIAYKHEEQPWQDLQVPSHKVLQEQASVETADDDLKYPQAHGHRHGFRHGFKQPWASSSQSNHVHMLLIIGTSDIPGITSEDDADEAEAGVGKDSQSVLQH